MRKIIPCFVEIKIVDPSLENLIPDHSTPFDSSIEKVANG